MATKFEVAAREALVGMMVECFRKQGWEAERVTDYGSVAVQVEIEGETRWMVAKVTAPKLEDKEGNAMWTIEDGVAAYEDRVKRDAEKVAEKLAKDEEKKKAAAARKAAKDDK